MDVDSYEPRDRSGHHNELEQAPFHPQPSSGFANFNSTALNAAPLLLSALNTPKKAPTYDPSQWYSQGSSNRTPVHHLATQEVDMDSPARPGPSAPGPDEDDGEGKQYEEEHEEKKPRKFAKGAVSRTNKKRQQAKKERGGVNEEKGLLRHSDSAAPAFSKSEHHYNVHMQPSALRHSEIPALLYLQFFVNACIVLFCIYLAVLFVLAVRSDVKNKMNEYSVEILQEIAECTNMYLTNMCGSAHRVPHMDAPCRAWDACMNRDPTVMGRINIIAEVFAGVINSFVEPISWKTMSFTVVTLTFLVILTNSALFNLRARASHNDTPPPVAPFWPPHGQFMPQLPSNMPQGPGYQHDISGMDARIGGVGGPHGVQEEAKQIGWTEKKKGWW
ncbi:hypothetical protein B9479_001405 [Cryptococcus floricola]|uniref:Brl1/Brr6 domain-containing protein n=1 Tax=Cryptococcus floricola TaxID=2591691 RepID=A0A5D3B256_9TREE|nr:hypothetical protein B9479_001405 [Cryptococcus floricola]